MAKKSKKHRKGKPGKARTRATESRKGGPFRVKVNMPLEQKAPIVARLRARHSALPSLKPVAADPAFLVTTDLRATSDPLWTSLFTFRHRLLQGGDYTVADWHSVLFDIRDNAYGTGLRPHFGTVTHFMASLQEAALGDSSGQWHADNPEEDQWQYVLIAEGEAGYVEQHDLRDGFQDAGLRLTAIRWAQSWMRARERQLCGTNVTGANNPALDWPPLYQPRLADESLQTFLHIICPPQTRFAPGTFFGGSGKNLFDPAEGDDSPYTAVAADEIPRLGKDRDRLADLWERVYQASGRRSSVGLPTLDRVVDLAALVQAGVHEARAENSVTELGLLASDPRPADRVPGLAIGRWCVRYSARASEGSPFPLTIFGRAMCLWMRLRDLGHRVLQQAPTHAVLPALTAIVARDLFPFHWREEQLTELTEIRNEMVRWAGSWDRGGGRSNMEPKRLKFDDGRHIVTLGTMTYPLTPSRYAIVKFIAAGRGRFVSPTKGPDGVKVARPDQVLKGLKQALRQIIETEPGPAGGYRIDPRYLEPLRD